MSLILCRINKSLQASRIPYNKHLIVLISYRCQLSPQTPSTAGAYQFVGHPRTQGGGSGPLRGCECECGGAAEQHSTSSNRRNNGGTGRRRQCWATWVVHAQMHGPAHTPNHTWQGRLPQDVLLYCSTLHCVVLHAGTNFLQLNGLNTLGEFDIRYSLQEIT